MQSQQKRLKWSRGETAEALEERTDTGITQASVEFMENCIPDVYGNISRRPALKILPLSTNFDPTGSSGSGSTGLGIPADALQVIPFYISENDFLLIGIFNGRQPQALRIKNNEVVAKTTMSGSVFPQNKVSYSQQNNYLIMADKDAVYKVQFQDTNGYRFSISCSLFEYSANWYAPAGTSTKTVSTTEVPGLNFNGGFFSFTYNDGIITTVFSQIDTGLTNSYSTIIAHIPAGSIVQFPNIGCYFRVEGYYVAGNTHVYTYGALLTPVANNAGTDSSVSVETGYISLQPNFSTTVNPHPTKVCFYEQRLWAGGWTNSTKTDKYSLVIGSQIARYNDFKNDYNQENEPITLDILTSFKETIYHLIDYNGLKIFTDSYEYAYSGGGVSTQSANGSLEQCTPIVFESLCLYCDKTGHQIRAMQYELQSSIYDSTVINQIASPDLIWNPIGMASYEDKINHTGKYIFVINEKQYYTNPQSYPPLAVCNFVPSNQANIWSRWDFPKTTWSGFLVNRLYTVVNTKKEPIFMVYMDCSLTVGGEEGYGGEFLVPAILDFDGISDYNIGLTNNQVLFATFTFTGSGIISKNVLRNTEIDVFSNGQYKLTTTTNNRGYITEDLSGLENVTVGFKINSTIRSHPIDVGGKTKSEKKRIGKAQMSVHGTEPGAITLNGKTGYMNPEHDHICFYGVSGMKDELKYVITNNNGAMFHLESLLMNIEYGTLDS